MQVISRERSRRAWSSNFALSMILIATFSKTENGQGVGKGEEERGEAGGELMGIFYTAYTRKLYQGTG